MDTRNTIPSGLSSRSLRFAECKLNALHHPLRAQIIDLLLNCKQLAAVDLIAACRSDPERVKAHLGVLIKHKIVSVHWNFEMYYTPNKEVISKILRIARELHRGF